MLAVGRALITKPKMMLMDEPMEGLMPLLVKLIAETVKASTRKGPRSCWWNRISKTIKNICQGIYIMEKGTIVYEGTPSALGRRYRYSGTLFKCQGLNLRFLEGPEISVILFQNPCNQESVSFFPVSNLLVLMTSKNLRLFHPSYRLSSFCSFFQIQFLGVEDRNTKQSTTKAKSYPFMGSSHPSSLDHTGHRVESIRN